MRAIGTLLFLAAIGFASPSLAEPDATAAKAAFRDAQELFEAGDFEGALDKFGAALSLTRSPNARLYVARCLMELGRLTEAYEEMQTTLDEARTRADTEAKYAPTRDAAAGELALLERRVGRVIVALADPPEGVQVTIAGVPVPAAKLGAPVAVSPGAVTILATAPGGARAEREIDVRAGALESVALTLEPLEGDGPVAPLGPAPKPEEDRKKVVAPAGGGSLRTVGFIVTGVGVAGLATFAVAGSMSNSQFAELEDACGGTRCTDPKYASDVDRGKSLDLVATVGLVLGGAGVLGGVGILLFGPSDGAGTAAVGVDRDGAVLRLNGSF